MELIFKHKYIDLTDKEIVSKIITLPYNDEAATYLLYDRYSPKFRKLCKDIYNNLDWYDDCMDDLFDYLKGKELDWNKLRTFEWRCQFSTWIGTTARHRFIEIKPFLIGRIENPLYINGNGNDDENSHTIQLPDGGVEEYEERERKIILMEAISLLQDEDQRFVIIKRLQGYNSKEIAILLQKRWAKHGIVKYNNKKQVVIPDAAYVDVRTQRAKENLKNIITKLI